MSKIRLIHLVGISIVPITFAFWYKSRVQKVQHMLNMILFTYNIILVLYLLT